MAFKVRHIGNSTSANNAGHNRWQRTGQFQAQRRRLIVNCHSPSPGFEHQGFFLWLIKPEA
jgi:hypothetical protein